MEDCYGYDEELAQAKYEEPAQFVTMYEECISECMTDDYGQCLYDCIVEDGGEDCYAACDNGDFEECWADCTYGESCLTICGYEETYQCIEDC